MIKRILSCILNTMLILNCLSGACSAEGAAVLITASSPEGIYGNNFYKDNPPCFSVKVKNGSLVSSIEGTFSYNVTKPDGTVIIKDSALQDIEISPGEVVAKDIKIEKEYFGRLNLNIVVDLGNEKIVKVIPYTMSNNSMENPSNKKFGIAAHMGRNRGDIDTTLSLLKGAGIGTLRDEFITWPQVETTKGVYNFTEEMDSRLDLLDKYDLFYIHLWGHGNNNVYPDPVLDDPEWEGYRYIFPVSEDGLRGLSNYMEELVEFADGRIDVIEVWNEYNNMSGPYRRQYQYMVNYHKALYEGVQKAIKNGSKPVPVSGIDTDSWGVYKSTEFTDFLSLLGGEKVFDAVSFHPYNINSVGTPETGVTESIIERAKELLEQNGQNPDIDFYFTEGGWSDYTFDGDREMQAAYNLRHQAKAFTENLTEASCIYTVFDYGQYGGTIEGHFGILESYDAAYTQVPYLGKEAYPAIAYFNNLTADAQFAEKITSFGEDVFAYHFKDRMDRDILMLGTVNNNEATLKLNVGATEIIRADMYGNEKVVLAPNKEIEVNLSGKPVYLISEEMESISEIPELSKCDTVYGIVSGKTEGKPNIVLNVYNNGFSPENTTAKNVSEAFYYTEQKSTDENGNFYFTFPLNDNFKSKNAYIYIEDEDEPRIYKIESWGSFALSYEAFPSVDKTNHEFFAYLSGLSENSEGIELISAGYSSNNTLENVSVAENIMRNSNLFVKLVELDLSIEKSKLMVVSDFYTLKPLTPSINLR